MDLISAIITVGRAKSSALSPYSNGKWLRPRGTPYRSCVPPYKDFRPPKITSRRMPPSSGGSSFSSRPQASGDAGDQAGKPPIPGRSGRLAFSFRRSVGGRTWDERNGDSLLTKPNAVRGMPRVPEDGRVPISYMNQSSTIAISRYSTDGTFAGDALAFSTGPALVGGDAVRGLLQLHAHQIRKLGIIDQRTAHRNQIRIT
jgi:hypothetical protein